MSPSELILASALDVVTSVSVRNLAMKTYPEGSATYEVRVPRHVVQELAERIEKVHPGLIADVRRRREI